MGMIDKEILIVIECIGKPFSSGLRDCSGNCLLIMPSLSQRIRATMCKIVAICAKKVVCMASVYRNAKRRVYKIGTTSHELEIDLLRP